MKLIKAIIRPERLEFVKNSLLDLGCIGLTVIEVHGRGEQNGISLQYRGKKLDVDLIPKVLIEMVVPDEKVQSAIDAIMTAARTGKFGDGRIFVVPIEESIRIRTGEQIKD